MGLCIEQVSGILALLLHAYAKALAMLDQELRRAVVPPGSTRSRSLT